MLAPFFKAHRICIISGPPSCQAASCKRALAVAPCACVVRPVAGVRCCNFLLILWHNFLFEVLLMQYVVDADMIVMLMHNARKIIILIMTISLLYSSYIYENDYYKK